MVIRDDGKWLVFIYFEGRVNMIFSDWRFKRIDWGDIEFVV